jgi:hypothetical protein
MKKLMMLALVALLSFGVASVGWAQAPEGGQPAGGEMKTGKTSKKHHTKKKKKSKKGKKEEAPAAAPQ